MALEAVGHTVMKARVHNSDMWNVQSKVEASLLGVTTPYFIEGLIPLAADYQAEFDWGTAI